MIRCTLLIILSFFFARESNLPKEKPFSIGKASYYGVGFHGRKTANGEIYNKFNYTAAHRKLPFNTLLRVTNQKNSLSITVRINDRGPYNYSRIIDISEAAARRIGSYMHGLTTVKVEVLDLIKRTPELDSIFTSGDVFDCLGNKDELEDFSLQLYKTSDLVHMVYLANELYLQEDVEKVYITGNGKGPNRLYSLVISNYQSKEDALKGLDYYERKGFMNIALLKN